MKINEIKVGDKEYITRTISYEDVKKYSEISGDINPIHLDLEYAKKSIFKNRIVHGLLISGLISAVLGNKLPGNGSIYLSQTLKFLKPVMIGETITAEVEVISMDKIKNRITLKTRCFNNKHVDVLVGEALMLVTG